MAPPLTLPLVTPPAWAESTDGSGGSLADDIRAKGVAEIQRLIDSGKKQEALDKALEVFAIDTSHAKSITYDSSVSGEGAAQKDGTVGIGDDAFKSPGWLASSAGHEVEVHVSQQAHLGKWYTGAIGTPLQEVQAYDYEVASGDRYGLSADEKKDVADRRDDHYNGLPQEYKDRVDAGNYDMKPGEEGL